MTEIQVGDKVLFLPGVEHALHKDIAGDYPWVIGLRATSYGGRQIVSQRPNIWTQHGIASPQSQQAKPEELPVIELDSKELNEVLEQIRRHPAPEEEKKRLVFLRPAKAWDAVVRNVNDDGTVNLDIQSNNGGVTLHYDNVLLDHKKRKPHSCHAVAVPKTAAKENSSARMSTQEEVEIEDSWENKKEEVR